MDVQKVRERARRAIEPIKAANSATSAAANFLFAAQRSDAGRELPPYYLVYLLLVDLLGFRNLGQFEKVAWSVPVEFNGRAFLIEHRKFGLGIFIGSHPEDEADAAAIVARIHKGVKAARPYFDWRAQEAAKASQLNVVNRSRELFARFEFYADLYDGRRKEAEARADEVIKTQHARGSTLTFPAYRLNQEARWLALSAIESFFSWTEHVFIHIAILRGCVATGEDVAYLARAEWGDKFKAALSLDAEGAKRYYDDLSVIRRQLRNFVAHGAFGKDGEAFHFHSSVGAIPMLLPHKRNRSSFRFGQGVDIASEQALATLRSFVDFLWSGPRASAKIYVQDYEHPLILSNAANGEYVDAMSSVDAMESYAHNLAQLMELYANMDF